MSASTSRDHVGVKHGTVKQSLKLLAVLMFVLIGLSPAHAQFTGGDGRGDVVFTADVFFLATQLAITTQPVGGPSGLVLATPPVIEVQDEQGNRVTDDSSTEVTVMIESGADGTLGGAQTVTAVNGVATFTDLTLAGAVGEDYVLRFTSDPALTMADSDNVNVSHGVALHLILSGMTDALAAGAERNITATIEDGEGNTVTTGADASLAVVFAQSGGAGTVSGLGSQTAVDGVAALTVTGEDAGSLTLAVSATTGAGEAIEDEITFTITAGAADQLAFVVQPSETMASQTVTPAVIVEIRDSKGNLVTAASDEVTVALTTPGDATLSGTLSVNAEAGVATFADLSVDMVGSYSLTALADGLDPDDSGSFAVTASAADADASTIAANPTEDMVADGSDTSQITVTIRDADGNIRTDGGNDVFIEASLGDLSAVTDQNNGTYSATLTSTDSGTATVTAYLGSSNNGDEIGTTTVAFVAGEATQIVINDGNNQSAMAGEAVTTAPSVIGLDTNQNPVEGVSVTFAVATGDGSITGETATTNVDGIATVGSWTLGTTAGENTLTAAIAGREPAISITFTATVEGDPLFDDRFESQE